MKPIRLLLTSCGCPGASTLVRMLKREAQKENRSLTIVGIDNDEEAIGRFLCDVFYLVHPYTNENMYIWQVLDIIEKEQINVVLPENATEAYLFAKNKGTLERLGAVALVSDERTIQIADNKYLLYSLLQNTEGINLPKFYSPSNLQEFTEMAKGLDWPNVPICFKPHQSKGSRGFRIIHESKDRLRELLYEKPNAAKTMGMSDFWDVFESRKFPDLLVMEYIEGTEYTADCLCTEGEPLITEIKSNERARWGVTVRGELVNRPQLVEQTRKILEHLPLSYCINLQFIDNRLIEINPRVSTFIYQGEFVMPWLAIRLALGEIWPEQAKQYQDQIAYGHRFVRYFDQHFI